MVFRDQTNHTINRSKECALKRDGHYRQHNLILAQCSGNIKPESYFKSKDRRHQFSRMQKLLASQHLPQAIAPGSMVGYQFFASYLNSYFPSQGSPSCPLDMSDIIISGIHMLPRKSPMVEKASSALSSVFLGKLHRDHSLLRHGLGLYTQALGQMSRKLDRKAYSDDMIYACVLFDQIEVRSSSYSNLVSTFLRKAHRKPDSSLSRISYQLVLTYTRIDRNYADLPSERYRLPSNECYIWTTPQSKGGE